MPALLTRTSMRPNSSYAASTRASISFHRPTWQTCASARRPARRTSAAASSQASCLRLATTTSAPACASVRTIARPRPRVPPVTSATRPVRSNRSYGAATDSARSCCMPNRLLRSVMTVAAVVDELLDGPAVDEDVQVPEHLPDHEDGLTLGGLVRPQAARDLERRAAAVAHVPRDQVEPPGVEREPLLDQGPVVVDHRPVAGIAPADLHRLRLAQVPEVLEQRAASLVSWKLGRHDLRAGRDLGEEVVADEDVG